MRETCARIRAAGYQQQQQADRQGGQEWWGPWTAAPPLSAAGRGGTEWAVRVGTERAVGGGDGDRPRRGGKGRKRESGGSSRASSSRKRWAGSGGPRYSVRVGTVVAGGFFAARCRRDDDGSVRLTVVAPWYDGPSARVTEVRAVVGPSPRRGSDGTATA